MSSTIAGVRMVQKPRFFLLALLAWSLTVEAYPVPEGTEVLRNGDFSESSEKPIHWVTRSTGELGSFELIEPQGMIKDRSLNVTVTRAHQQPWMLELRQKLSEPLRKGQTLFLGFEYRISEGYAFHCYWQKDSPPWPKFLALRVDSPVDNWDVCMVTVPVPENLDANQTSLSFHLAEAPGDLQIRNIKAVVVDKKVNPADIETTVEPVVGGDYYDRDWRRKVVSRIDQIRKAELTVAVSADGVPRPGATVAIQQTGRPFSVGIEVRAPLLSEQNVLDDRAFASLKRRIGDDAQYLPKLREKIADTALFDTVTLSEGLTWRDYDYWGKKLVPELIDQIRDRGQRVRGHAIFIPTFRFAPPKCRLMAREDLLKAIEDHIAEIATDLQGRVDQWVVLHGMLTYSEIYDIVGADILPETFRRTRQNAPEARLLVSDAEALLVPDNSRIEELIEFVRWLQAEGAQIDALLLSASLSRPYMAPQAMEERLDLIANSGLDLPVYIGSLKLESDKEKMQAAMLKDLLTLFYSHPAVHGISLACPWEASAINQRCALYRKNMAPCKSGSMLEDLLTDEWITNVEGQTDEDGRVSAAAFIGTYRITAEFAGRETTVTAELTPESQLITVALPPEVEAENQ